MSSEKRSVSRKAAAVRVEARPKKPILLFGHKKISTPARQQHNQHNVASPARVSYIHCWIFVSIYSQSNISYDSNELNDVDDFRPK